MRFIIPTLAITLALTAAPALAQESPEAATSPEATPEATMLAQINELRASHELAPLAGSPALDRVAQTHSVDMASRRQLGHVSPVTGSPADRTRAAGIEVRALAENVAFDRNGAQAMQALVASPGHLENILSPSMTHVGLSVHPIEDSVYVTQLFARDPSGSAPPAVAEAPAAPAEDPRYALIPPHLEEGAPLPAPAAETAEASAPQVAEAAPAQVPAQAEAPPEAPAPRVAEAAPAAAPASEAASEAAPATRPADANANRSGGMIGQLFGLADAILGGGR